MCFSKTPATASFRRIIVKNDTLATTAPTPRCKKGASTVDVDQHRWLNQTRIFIGYTSKNFSNLLVFKGESVSMSRNISRDMQHELYKLFSKGRGVSKRAERAKNDHKKSPYIHSRAYLESCLAEVKNYGQWLKEHGERGATMERARELAPAYIAEKRAAGGSAWSQNLTRSSLAKVFGCNARELGPVDRRDSRNITRGRDRSGDEKLGPIRAADRAVMQCVPATDASRLPLGGRAYCFRPCNGQGRARA